MSIVDNRTIDIEASSSPIRVGANQREENESCDCRPAEGDIPSGPYPAGAALTRTVNYGDYFPSGGDSAGGLMKIGISAFAWTSEFRSSHLELLPAMKSLGLTGIEIPMSDPVRLPVEDIKSGIERSGLDRSVCAILPPEINPISPDKATRQRSAEHLKIAFSPRLQWAQSCSEGLCSRLSAICRTIVLAQKNGAGQWKCSGRFEKRSRPPVSHFHLSL